MHSGYINSGFEENEAQKWAQVPKITFRQNFVPKLQKSFAEGLLDAPKVLDAFVPIRCCSWFVPHDLLHLNKGYSGVCFFTACLLAAPQGPWSLVICLLQKIL